MGTVFDDWQWTLHPHGHYHGYLLLGVLPFAVSDCDDEYSLA